MSTIDLDARAAELLARLRATRWYLVRDDEVGGFAIATVDRPTSEQDLDAGDRTMFFSVWEELGRDVVATHNAALDLATLDDYLETGQPPAPYLRPAALDAPPPSERAYLSWVERQVRSSATVGAPPRDVWVVCHAYAVRIHTDRPNVLTWAIQELAEDVEPLAGAQLVDGLRALRAVRGPT